MNRLVGSLVAAIATLVAFVVTLWVGWVAGIRLWPHALKSVSDRWVVATAFATVMAGAVLACVGWWAGREDRRKADEQSTDGHIAIQDVHASEGGSVYGVLHGNQHIYHHDVFNVGPDSSDAPEDDQNGHD